MLLWSLLFFTFVICAVSAFPTKFYVVLGSWLSGVRLAGKTRALAAALARQAALTPFTAQTDFCARGVGVALDGGRRLVFVAQRQGSGLRSAILPFADMREVRAGEQRDNGFYDYYVELTTADSAQPAWRLMCGEDQALAADVKDALMRPLEAIPVPLL